MAFDFSLSDFSAPSWDMSGFNLGGLDTSLNLGDWGGGMPSTPTLGGSGGFDWGSIMKNVGVGADILKTGVTTGLGIQSQMANAKYQKQLQDYYKSQQAAQAAYNKSVQDYLTQRAAWESQMTGMFGDVASQFQDQMTTFQDTIGGFSKTIQGVVDQELSAAKPLLSQSQELLKPAVAALAKGEVPPLFAPVLEQAKQRARAAAMQQYANAGIDASSAAASIEPQIDEQVTQMLIQQATAMLSGGLQTSNQGLGFLSGATQGASAGIQGAVAGLSPIEAEFRAMMSSLSGLLGGFPGLAGGTPPPPPVA
jgi:hypothetical protein